MIIAASPKTLAPLASLFMAAGLFGFPAAYAQSSPDLPSAAPEPLRQSLDDAWWTGPMLANSAGALPAGHALVEPYLFDVMSKGGDTLGSLTYLLYGVTDKLSIGARPFFGVNIPKRGPKSSRIGMGDLTLQAQYQLSSFRASPWRPALAISLQHSLPTGKYDRLGTRPSDGLGSGAHATTIALYAQNYSWLPNGRLLRTRLNISQTISGEANVEGVSVYGTREGFKGHARPGNTFLVGGSAEYSITKHWVLALDLTYARTGGTRVAGIQTDQGTPPTTIDERSGRSDGFAIAPGIEYNFSGNVGILVATRFIPKSHNTGSSVTPAIALNMVF